METKTSHPSEREGEREREEERRATLSMGLLSRTIVTINEPSDFSRPFKGREAINTKSFFPKT